jgi:hypothetical protein
MSTFTPCRGHGRVYDAAVSPRTPSAKRFQARIIASSICSRCPIAGSCPDRITPPSPRFIRKVAAMSPTEPAPATARPAPQLVQPTPGQPATPEALIAWGAAHPSSRVQAIAGKVTGALGDLRQAYEKDGKVQSAEARVARLKLQLANAQKDLAAVKGGKAKGAGAAVDYAAVRAWANAQGIEVHPHGRPRQAVIDDYYAAQAERLAATG